MKDLETKALELPDFCTRKDILSQIIMDKIFFKDGTTKINPCRYRNYMKTYNRTKVQISDKTIDRNLNVIKKIYSPNETQNEDETVCFPNPALTPSTKGKNDDIPNLFRERLKYLLKPFTSSNEEDTSFEDIEVNESFFPLLWGIIGKINQSKNNWSNWSKFRQDTFDLADSILSKKYKNNSLSEEYSNTEWLEYASYLLEFYFSDPILKVAKKLVSMKNNQAAAIRINASHLISELPNLKFKTNSFQNKYYTELLDKLNNPNKSNNYEIALAAEFDKAIPEYKKLKQQEDTIYSKMYDDYYECPISELLKIIKSES